MKIGEIRRPRGAVHRKKRLGFGESSGHGKTSTKGHKGQRARSGPGLRPEFEGGQTPLVRRIPKRGFHHVRSAPRQIVNVGTLARFAAGTAVNPALLEQEGLIESARHPVKILGEGALTQALKVQANAFSESARAKITAAGGSADLL